LTYIFIKQHRAGSLVFSGGRTKEGNGILGEMSAADNLVQVEMPVLTVPTPLPPLLQSPRTTIQPVNKHSLGSQVADEMRWHGTPPLVAVQKCMECKKTFVGTHVNVSKNVFVFCSSRCARRY
jgi:hypothetical protein